MPAGAQQAGMAYVSVMRTDFWSAFHNQASLSLCRKTAFGINYENRYGLPELATCTAGIAITAGRASLGTVYSHFGYRDFRRQMAGLACGLPLGEKISGGIQIDLYSEKTFGEYAGFQSLTFEAGLLFRPDEKTTIGVHVFNPVPGSLRKREMISTIRAGAGISLYPGLFAGAETELTSTGLLDVRTGLDYNPVRDLWLRAGFRTQHSSFSLGLGYRFGKVQMDIAFSTHDQLGVTSSVSLIFNLK